MSLLLLLLLAAPVQLLHAAPPTRRLATCGGGCQRPIPADDAEASLPTAVNVQFSSPYLDFAGAPTGYRLAYSICYALECNYRNVTVTFAAGNTISKLDMVYLITFYTLPGQDKTLLPAALVAALPSTDPMNADSILYSVRATSDAAMPTVSGLFAGWGAFSPPAAGPLPPAPPGGWPPPRSPAQQSAAAPPTGNGGLAVGIVLLLAGLAGGAYALYRYQQAQAGGAGKRGRVGRPGFAELVESAAESGRPRTRGEILLAQAVPGRP